MEPAAADPGLKAQQLAKASALKAATISGSFTLPPGPLGLATVVPELFAVWRVQQQLVADIAAAYGKSPALTPETMVICLFKHGGAAITGRLFSKVGDDIIVQRIANRTLQQLIEKIAIRLTQRLAAKSLSRWVPMLGALGAGAYAYYDTTHVAATSIEIFSRTIRVEQPEDALNAAATHNRAATPSRSKRPSRKKSPASKAPRAPRQNPKQHKSARRTKVSR